MKKHDNTLYVTTQGAYLAREGTNVLVRVEKQTRLRIPVHNLGGLVCFGNVEFSQQSAVLLRSQSLAGVPEFLFYIAGHATGEADAHVVVAFAVKHAEGVGQVLVQVEVVWSLKMDGGEFYGLDAVDLPVADLVVVWGVADQIERAAMVDQAVRVNVVGRRLRGLLG